MKLVIDGREYPVVTTQTAELLHLMELQQQAKALVEGGLGMSALQRIDREAGAYRRAMTAWQEAGADPGSEPDVPDNSVTAMAVTVFLSRRAAGDQVTFQDAARIGMDAIIQMAESMDAQASDDAVDPTPPGGGPATPDVAAPGATPSASTRSKTSPSQSAAGRRSSPTSGQGSPPGTSSD